MPSSSPTTVTKRYAFTENSSQQTEISFSYQIDNNAAPIMKNFLIITQVFRPDPAAIGQYLDEAAQAIAVTGAEVTILTANRGYDNPRKSF